MDLIADVLRVSLTGSAVGGEKWSVNPVWAISGGAAITFTEANAIVTAVNGVTVPAAVRLSMSSTNSLTGCRVEARKATGELETLAEGLRTTPVTGTGAAPHPAQIAWTVSLRTNSPGGSGRGRLYWPATGQAIGVATLRPTVSDATTFLTGFALYLNQLEAAIDGVIDETVDLCVWSRVNASRALVTKVLVGDVLDTQRRRRDLLPEAYQELAYP